MQDSIMGWIWSYNNNNNMFIRYHCTLILSIYDLHVNILLHAKTVFFSYKNTTHIILAIYQCDHVNM